MYVCMKCAGYLDLKGAKNRPNKHDTLRAFACLIDYMYFLDENTTVNGTVVIFDAVNYTMKLHSYISLEERRDFVQTWQVYKLTYRSKLSVVFLWNRNKDYDHDDAKKAVFYSI